LSALAQELHGKRLALLKETTPGIVRVALLWSAASQGASVSLREARAAAQTLGIQIQSVQVREPKDLEGALDAIKQQRAQALMTAPDPAINAHGARIVEFAARNRLPAIYAAPEFVQAGGLMAYAPNYGDMWRRAATYADKILKGARPADLPVEQPTKFEFTVNLKAAKQIGLTIPPAVLGRADKVIE
jgi:putative ABC transport system substrate-binding protein